MGLRKKEMNPFCISFGNDCSIGRGICLLPQLDMMPEPALVSVLEFHSSEIEITTGAQPARWVYQFPLSILLITMRITVDQLMFAAINVRVFTKQTSSLLLMFSDSCNAG